MSLSHFTHTAVAACLLLAASAAAIAGPAPKKPGFETYALLRTRNIFDPERQPGATAAAPTPSQVTPGRADFAALTGVMITPEKILAFFSGSRPEYSGVLPVGSVIAGARLTRIDPDAIEVERNGKRTLVAVGQTVPLDATSVPTAPPAVTVAPADPSAAAPTGADTASSTPSASAPASADRGALIRRMMEKRQQELQ